MDEIWKPVNDIYFRDFYQVSNLGNVRRLNKTKSPRLLKPYKLKSGYLQVCLCVDNYKELITIHRIVALAFLQNKDTYTNNEVDHIDRDKMNNKVQNLRWVSKTENCKNRKSFKGIYIITDTRPNKTTMYRVNYYENNKRIRVGFATKSMAEQLYLLKGGDIDQLINQ